MTGHPVEEGAEQLAGPQPHVLEGLVDQQLVEGELVGRDVGETSRLCLHRVGDVGRVDHVGDEPDAVCVVGADGPPGEQVLLGVFESSRYTHIIVVGVP